MGRRPNSCSMSKCNCYLLAIFILFAFAGVIIGLVFGLKKLYSNDCVNSLTGQQVYDKCLDLTCKNVTVLNDLNDKCLGTTTRTTSFTTTLSQSTGGQSTGSQSTAEQTSESQSTAAQSTVSQSTAAQSTASQSTGTQPTTSVSTTQSTTTSPKPTINYRLPTNLKPHFYDITTITTFDKFTEPDKFNGIITIEFSCIQNTKTIVIHQYNIDIDQSTIRVNDGNTQINVVGTSYDEDTDFCSINLSDELQSGKNYSLSMKYTGKILANNVGFYKSFYVDADGKKVSQMEPTDARSAFPCFDEPAMKARFKMTVIHNKDLTAFSNMPGKVPTVYEGDLRRTEFDTTVQMSTYLVALIISDYECKGETILNSGEYGSVDVRVCGRADEVQKDRLAYALKTATTLIKYYEQFFGVKYPLPKSDHVTVPDFLFGAMENWGLITYRESVLFYDPATSSDVARQNVVIYVAHELAHMWFGNLVSPEWWNDLWLNEGFATYVEYIGTDYAEKSFLMFEQFVEEVFDILQLDAVANSHPILVEVNNPDEINEIFDDISYGKGGCLIRMMNYMLGESTFTKGVKNYLDKYKFSNAIQDFLWEELDKAAKSDGKLLNLNLTDVMDTWTRQMGHPLISVENIDNNRIKISQKHFLLDPTSTPTEASIFNYKWYVPFSYSVEKLGSISTDLTNVNMENLYGRIEWLEKSQDSKTIQLTKPLDTESFILANLDVSGFYRVNYDEANWNKIIRQLNNNKDAIPTRTRAQLINDAFGLSQAEILDATRPFEIIRYLTKETEYLPWIATIGRLGYFTSILDSTSAFTNYEKYLVELITPMFNRLGWDEKQSDTWLDRRLRATVLSFACAREFPSCVNKAKQWYAKWMQNENDNPIPSSYRSFVYCTAIRNGAEIEWEFSSTQYDKEQSAIQKNYLQQGMSCAKQPWLISRFLNDQLNSSKVRLQDARSGLSAAASKSYANARTWTFVKENWDSIYDKISMSQVLASIAAKFNTEAQLNDFQKFFDDHPNQGSAARQVKLSIDRIKANIRWMKSGYDQLNTWLTTPQVIVTPEKLDYRLPKDLLPYHYDVLVRPQFVNTSGNSFPYDGETTIYIDCVKDTSTLVFHVNKLLIDNSTLSIKSVDNDPSFSEIIAFSWRYDAQRHFFIADLPQSFKAGQKYSIYIKFVGYLTDDNAGFYRSSYTASDGTKKWLLTSQMESTDARKSFPCFDEPAMKARFTIRVIHTSDYNSLSNMPIDSIQTLDNNLVQTNFLPTPKMSSYLVALVVSDFVCINDTAVGVGLNGNLPVRSCGRPTAVDQLQFGLEFGTRIFEYLEKLFEVKFPLPKCDHIAIPDFAAGAMENWGLITYRQAQYLYQEGVTTPSTQQSIGGTIVHEVVHMWFGDIVSPQWWDDTWLNEGFARYFQYIGAAQLKPEWQMLDQFKNLFFNLLLTDSNPTRPISMNVSTPSEISAMFDDLSYGKGGSVLSMVNYFLGNQTFNKGLRRYLARFSYGNTVGQDLWDTVDEVVKEENKLNNLSLNQIMNTWFKQMGHPVVTIKRVNAKTITLTQNRFLLDPSLTTNPSPYNYKWYIPFTHTFEKVGSINPDTVQLGPHNIWEKVTWLLPYEETKTVVFDRELGDDEFILANLDAAGFYRVNYDNYFYERIAKQLMTNKDSIPTANRAQFIHDVLAFSEARIIDPENVFEVMQYLSTETEDIPFLGLINRIGYLSNVLVTTSVFGSFQNYISNLIRPLYKKLEWYEKPESDTWIERINRANIVQFSCLRGVSECVNQAKSSYETWMLQESNNPIPSNYRSFVYCTAIREGGEKEWQFASDRYAKETSATERTNLQNGMSCATLQWLVSRYLEDQIDTNKVRVAEGLTGIRYAAVRPTSYLKTWNFMKDNWNLLFSRYSTGVRTLIADFATIFNTQELLNDFNNFFNNIAEQSLIASDLVTYRNRIQRNVNWYNKNFNRTKKWFFDKVETTEELLKDVRLPTDIAPTLYDLTIQPYIGPESVYGDLAFTYNGTMNIYFTCVNPTNQIVFHVKDYEINNSTLRLTSTDDPTLSLVLPWTNDFAREFFKANFTRNCIKDANYVLHIDYFGEISRNLAGFYRSSFFDVTTNQTSYLATTDFEPTDARRAFPCFDEPAMKAKLKLTIVRHKSFITSFGNMPHESFDQPIPDNPDWRMDTFKESVPMSTYLVAFVIANYKTVNKTSPVKNIFVEVAARPNAIDAGEGDFALNEAANIIDFFAEYFNTPYPLDKSTQIAIPDFNSGAMENWGLITYREPSLLYNPDRDTIANKRRVSVVVSHELAHQWFGNLVTPEWWNDLWLNEGFASWVEYLGYNKTHPEWRDLDSFFTQRLSVLVKDSLESSHPISVQVDNPDEINAIFDSITYDKGASIIRMMNSFLSEKTFRGGVSNYLDKYKYKNAKQDDLWEELTEQAYLDTTLDEPLTVKMIMDKWTLQKGYPVVTLERDYANNKVKLSQKWFLLNPDKQSAENTQEWYVPFTHTTQKDGLFIFESRPLWLKPGNGEVSVTVNANANEWVIGNLHHSGFYRVNYDMANWNMIIKQLTDNHLAIHEINRATLIDDSFNLGRAEKLPQKIFLDIVKYLENEEDPIPWTAAFSGLGYIGSMLGSTNTGIFSKHKNFYKQLLRSTYLKYGWSENLGDATLIDLQLQAISVLCTYDDSECIDVAKMYFKDWKETGKEIPSNFKLIVYQTAIKFGSEDDWYFLFEEAKKTTSNTEQVRMFRALASTREFYLLKFLLSQTSNPSVIKPQDETTIIAAINSNIAGRSLAWDHFVSNWDSLFQRYGKVSFTLGTLVTNLVSAYNTQDDLQKVIDFIQRNPDQGTATASFKENIETISTNIRWMKTNYDSIAQFLSEQV